MRFLLLSIFVTIMVVTPTVLLGQDNALHFDGSDDHIVVTNPSDFNIGDNTNFTVEAVIKTTRTNTAIFSKMDNSVTGYQIWVFGGKFLLEWSGSQNISSTTNVNDGQCHHVAVVVDRAAQNAKLYVDGVLETNITDSKYGQDVDNANPVYIGQERTLASGLRWSGEMDEVSFFTEARSSSEIMASATTQLTGSEPGLIGYWKFDEGTAGANNAGITNLPDASGNGHNGILMNFGLNGTSSNWLASSCAQTPPPPPVDPIPTISQWMLFILGLIIASLALVYITKQKWAVK